MGHLSPYFMGVAFVLLFFTSNNRKFSFMSTFAWDSDTYTLLFLLGDSLSQKKTVVQTADPYRALHINFCQKCVHIVIYVMIWADQVMVSNPQTTLYDDFLGVDRTLQNPRSL